MLIETFEDINIKLLETFININKIKMDHTYNEASNDYKDKLK